MRSRISAFVIAISLCILALLQSVCFASIGTTADIETEQIEQIEQIKPSEDVPQTSFLQVYEWTGSLPKDLMALKTVIIAENVDTSINAKLPELKAEIHDLQWNVRMTETEDYLGQFKSNRFDQQLSSLNEQLTVLDVTLLNKVSRLSNWREEWSTNSSKLANITRQDTLGSKQISDLLPELNLMIDEVLQLIDVHLESALIAGRTLHNLEIQLQSIDADLRKINNQIDKNRTLRASSSIISADFYTHIGVDIFVKTYTNAKQFFSLHYELLKENFHNVIIGSFLFLILCVGVYHSKNLILASCRWYPFANSPFATTVFATTAIFVILNRLTGLVYENHWDHVLTIFTLLSMPRLIKNCIKDKWQQKTFTHLSVFMAIIMVLVIMELPQALMLLFIFGTSLVTFTLYVKSIFTKGKSGEKQNTRQSLIGKAWGVVPAVVMLSSLAGYEQFAIFIFSTFISSISFCLICWMLFHFHSGLLELLLKVSPFSLFQENLSVIVKNLQPLIALVHILLATVILLVLWDIYPSIELAYQGFNDMGFDILELHISPNFLVTIYIVIYGAILFSRATQSLLINQILPHYNTGKGAQISITRLVHYAILTIGFFVMLSVLGFELKQLTILGGALGVGIGFGLQAIVNNFVSGLILLFERPVKVGDTIQVNTELGEVKEIGLRATIIQTFDHSEIVIPNADLVTGQVTNWTLAERKVRIRLPVGVAYGTDVTKVLEILQGCADSHPMVLSTPTPSALFLAFGASSLDFELRFWIPEFLDKMTATSELNQSIESEFALNNIEVPFMQADLHIRSVDTVALEALSGQRPTQHNNEINIELGNSIPG